MSIYKACCLVPNCSMDVTDFLNLVKAFLKSYGVHREYVWNFHKNLGVCRKEFKCGAWRVSLI